MKGQPAYGLIFSLIAVAAITAGYVYLAKDGPPRPGGPVGHGLGIVGFLMMLSTEILYSVRKRLQGFTFGQMSTWLEIHIFTGLVGPYLVLLHSAWSFNGLAGVLTLLTLMVVLSGLVGRYIYTAVPRTLGGTEVAVVELEEQIASADRQLQEKGLQHLAIDAPQRGWVLVLGRHFLRWRQRRRLRRVMREMDDAARAQAAQLQTLLAERHRLRMQINSLESTRRLLALWHVFHIPLSGVLFTVAFIHIAAALYYATFLR